MQKSCDDAPKHYPPKDNVNRSAGHLEYVYASQRKLQQMWNKKDIEIVSTPSDSFREKASIVEKYIAMASRYADLDITRESQCKDKFNQCVSCWKSLEDATVSKMGQVICPHCNTFNLLLANNSNSKDDTPQLTVKDDTLDNFECAIKKYCGLQERPKAEIIDKLDRYFASTSKPTRAWARGKPLNRYGKVDDTSCKMVIEALSAIKETSYYEDVNLIGHLLWGWKLADLRDVKDKMMMHFRKTQKAFNLMHPSHRGRTSALGTQFRLFMHLLAVGHVCRFEDFKIPESAVSLSTHRCLWKRMCMMSKDLELEEMQDVDFAECSSEGCNNKHC